MPEFRFPDVGEGITEGEIIKWRVKEGDVVKEHDIICDVETDKAIVELPSPYSGKVLRIHHKEGDTIKVGEVLVTIGEKGEVVKEPKESRREGTRKDTLKEKRISTGVVGEIPETLEVESEMEITPQIKVERIEGKVLATPATRRLAKELGVDITKIQGTGVGGRITEADVRNAAKQVPREKVAEIKIQRKYDMYGYIERVPLKGIRKVTAQNMRASLNRAAHVTHMEEVDITELVKLREKEKAAAEKKKVHLTFLPFIVKAVIAALKEFPLLNATLDDEHEEIIVKKYYNIGIAVDVNDGLIVLVIKEADKKSILEIAREIETLADSARERKIDLADLRGGSLTITNYGSVGGIFGTPIINYPEVAILGVGRIQEKPVVINRQIDIRKILPLSLSFDHRVVDGAYVARFVNEVKRQLEDPELLLME